MSVEVVDQDNGWIDIQESIKDLTSKEVHVGYEKTSGEFGVTELALVQEFGTKIKVTDKMRGYLGSQGLHLKKTTEVITIPSRPFIRDSFDNNVDGLSDSGIELMIKTLEGQIDPDMAYEIWGDSLKGIIQNGVTSKSLGLEENNGFTQKRKGSGTPLIDTGRLINGIEVNITDE